MDDFRQGWMNSFMGIEDPHLLQHLSASSWHPGLGWMDGGGPVLLLMSTGQALAGTAMLIISRHRIYCDFGLTLPWSARLFFIRNP